MDSAKNVAGGGWKWFLDNILPAALVSTSGAILTSAYLINQSVTNLTFIVDLHSQQIKELKLMDNEIKLEIKTLRDAAAHKTELIAVLRRVEEQIEIAMLRAGIKAKIKVTEQ